MLKTIQRAIKSIALAGVIMFGAIIAPEAHNHYLRYVVGSSVVQVLHPHRFGGGTGFAIQGKSGKNYIMTNRHVCGVQVDGFVRIKQNNKEYRKKVIYQDDVHDLCLIEEVKGLTPIKLGFNQAEGDTMYVVGHPGLRSLTTSQGEYIGRKTIDLTVNVKTREECDGQIQELPPFYQIMFNKEFICLKSFPALSTTTVIYGGNSGSPTVNKFGYLIGVAFAGNAEQERDNYIIPLWYVKRVLNKF